MKTLLLLIAAASISLSAAAQNYDYGLGVRVGASAGIDFKWNTSARNSWEFNLNFPNYRGFSASAAYQWNWAIGSQSYNGQGWNAYAGPAAQMGLYGFNRSNFLFGFGAHGGIEYKFDIPLALAIDYRPMFNFVTNRNGLPGWGFYDFAIAIRYAF